MTKQTQTKSEIKITKQAVPLREDGAGGLRVGATRVTLDGVIYAWKNGATAEGILQSYDTLQLADVHAVLAFYLQHEKQVEAYLQRREKESEEMREWVESQYDVAGLTTKLRQRHAASKHSTEAKCKQARPAPTRAPKPPKQLNKRAKQGKVLIEQN